MGFLSLRSRRAGLASAVRAAACVLLAGCIAAAAAQSCTTSITGTVYAPNGTDPLPNVLVYLPTTTVQPFSAGVSSCLAQEQLVSGNPLVSTITAADGTYTLTTNTTLAGSQVPLVIQAGKWRRQLTVPTVTACATTTFSTRMPQTHLEGDIPQIAVVTGASDSIECVLRKVGIQDSEFSDPAIPVSSSTGRVNLYLGGIPGNSNTQAGAEIDSATPYESTLMQVPATLNSYDLVVLACEGTDVDPVVTTTTQTNLIDYANIGGRIFGTHYAYVWLDDDPPFSGTALWQPLQNTPSGTSANINTTFADGKTLADWLQDIGATTTYGVIPFPATVAPRKDQNGVVPPTQSWLTLQDPVYVNPVMQFTFDTPVSTTTATPPTLTVTFANTPATSFLVADPADTIAINVANTGTISADSSLTLNVVLDPDLTATAIAGTNANTGWVCSLALLSCSRNTPLSAGASDPITVTVSVSSTATLGSASLASVTLVGGGLGGTQCGRVLFNEYHVELETASPHLKPFPTECPATPMSAQEKLLEYDLFDLSNFVATPTVDTGLIQDGTTTTLTGVVTPIFYGQIIADVAIEATTADNGYNLDGGLLSFYINGVDTCDLAANQAGACPPTTGAGYDVGTYQVQSCYQGDTNFAPSCSPLYTVVINPDPTSTTVTSSLNPSPEGFAVTFTATVADQYATARGTVNFYDSGTLIASSTANAQGVATFTTPNLIVGTHTISACLVASLDFLASSPCGSVQQVVQGVTQSPLNTVTLLVSSSNPSVLGQNVTFSAAVATTGAFPQIPAGSLSFYDGNTLLSATTLDSNGDASFSTSTLALGTHPITAVYAGNSIMAGSTSAVLQQLVIPALSSSADAFLLSVTPTSVSVGVGNSVTLTVTVTALPGFKQPVQLSCGNLPNEATCTFAQALVPPGGGSTTLTLTTAAPHACGSGAPDFIAPNSLGTDLPLLLLTTLGLFFARKRRRLQTLLLAVILCALPLLNGCSGNCTDFGTQPDNYTFTVTGTAVQPGITEVSTQAVLLHVHL